MPGSPTPRRSRRRGHRPRGRCGGGHRVSPGNGFLRYPADGVPAAGTRADELAEPLDGGPTYALAARAAAQYGIHVHTSLYERTGAPDGRGFNTAIVVAPSGEIVALTRKTHIPVTAGYYEDQWFTAGHDDEPYPVHEVPGIEELRLGMPTCWDEWFPEVARAYGLGGANVLAYPTAIGSEPDHPGVDTEPLWRQVIVAHGIENGLFMIVPNRTGSEVRPDGSPGNEFYGSSFVSDPYGRFWCARHVTARPCSSPTSIWSRDATGSTSSRSFRARRPDTYGGLL